MNRWLGCACSTVIGASLVMACSGNVAVGENVPHPEAGAETGADAKADHHVTTADALVDKDVGDSVPCVVDASAFSNECHVNADCVAVAVEVSVCQLCWEIACDGTALSKEGAAKYNSAINAASAAHPQFISDASCPAVGQCQAPLTPVCVHGACFLPLRDAGSDSGPDASTITTG
jgi:hypothetical protein